VKNDRAHDVPLSDLAVETLASLPKIASTRPLVFTTTGETPASGFSRAKRNLDKAIAGNGGEPVPPFTFHDLRRTFATEFPAARYPAARHRGGAQSQERGTIKRRRRRLQPATTHADEKRAALDAWARRLREISTGETAANVIPLRNTTAHAI
jgi:integrase